MLQDDSTRAAFGLDEYEANSYGHATPDALAYKGIGGAALHQAATFLTPKPATWPDMATRDTVLAAAENNLILWDFDGVVADTEPVQWESFRTLLNRYDFSPVYNFHHPLMGHTEPVIWEMLFAQGAPRDDIEHLIRTRSDIYINLAKRMLPMSWVAHELMPLFHGHSRKQYVISNGNPVNNQALLDHWGYSPYVKVIPLGRSTKAELFAHHTKTSPTPVVFEDSEKYARGAKENGAFVVGIKHGHSIVDITDHAHVTLHI